MIRRSRRTIIGALFVLAACGGGGGRGSMTGNGGGADVVWPDRDGGASTDLPAVVRVGRIVFESASGESCCIAVDPAQLSSQGSGLAILDDLPVGPATVTVAGFATDFAPSVPGITAECSASPPEAAHPCDPSQVAPAAFQSDPIPVDIIGGVQTNLGQVTMNALPFLFDFHPEQDQQVPLPVGFNFTVVDAATNVRVGSVALDVRFSVEDPTPVETPATSPTPQRPSFRMVSKRIPIQLSACADGTNTPCSNGDFGLAGFTATGTGMNLPDGPVEAHIVADNEAQPPQSLDFGYPFTILPTPTGGS